MEAQTHDGRRLRLMTLIDEFTRKCLTIQVPRRTSAIGVIETLADAMLFNGIPAFIRKRCCQATALSASPAIGAGPATASS